MLCSLLLVLGSFVALETPPSNPRHLATPDAADATAALLTTMDRRVRTGDPRIQMLMMNGIRRSATFASLIAALSATDVIVYIEPVRHLPPLLSGRLLLIPQAPGGQRYLRIQVMSQRAGNELIATIGHELQHALEIAVATDVEDQRGVERLYQGIGQAGAAKHTYDTEAAQTVGRRIRDELAKQGRGFTTGVHLGGSPRGFTPGVHHEG